MQVARPLAEFYVDDHVRAEFEFGDLFCEALAGGLEGDLSGRNLRPFVLLGRTANDKEIDRVDHLTATERGGGVASNELGFVGVVVENFADAIDILL